MNLPNKARAGGKFAVEWNRMVDALKSLRPSTANGTLIKHTPHGWVLSAATRHGGGGGGTSTTEIAERFRIRTAGVHGDYLTCETWDGTTGGGVDIQIAKPPKLRHSITSESIEGTTISYSYGARTNNNDGYRQATDGSTTIYEIVMPVYIIGDEIFATKPLRGTDVTVSSVECEYLDLNVDGRAWGHVV